MTILGDMFNDFYRWITSKDVPRFDPVEFERQRADNPLIKQLEIDRAKYERTRNEHLIIVSLTEQCTSIVMMYNKEIPHEDFAFFMLHEELTAFLPISIKPFLQPWDRVIIPMVHQLRQGRITSMKPSIE